MSVEGCLNFIECFIESKKMIEASSLKEVISQPEMAKVIQKTTSMSEQTASVNMYLIKVQSSTCLYLIIPEFKIILVGLWVEV